MPAINQVAMRVPPNAFDKYAGNSATAYMRNAPVLMKPLVGRAAMEATARAFAQQQAMHEARS